MLDFTIINPSTNLSAIGNHTEVVVGWVKQQHNPTKLNHKITKMLGNIRQPNRHNLNNIL
jgi:hypothetical protein